MRPEPKRTSILRACQLVCLLGLALAAVCCGGGGGQSFAPSPPPPPPVAITISPSSAAVLLGNTQQFTATVTNTANTGVNWSVNGVTGGNATAGTISSSGLYTAPQILPSPVTVTATSQADISKSDSATVSVTSDVGLTLATVPTGIISVQTNATVQFVATITSAGNPSQALNWSVNGVANGSSTVGTFATSGLNAVYTAPAAVPTPAAVTVQATSVADPAKSAALSLTITPPPIQVSVSPTSVTLQTGATQQFTAIVTGTTNTAVTWSVNDQVGGNSDVGTITAQGFYTAPAIVPTSPTVTVKATSVADATRFATAQVTIFGVPSISSVRPTSFAQGAAGPMTMSVTGINFSTSSVVRIDSGGGPDLRSTQFVNSRQLLATLPGSDFAAQRTGSIDVFQTPSGPQSNRVSFIVVAAPGEPQTVFLSAGQVSPGNDIIVTDASTTPGLDISFVGIGTARPYPVQVTRGTQATLLIFGTGLSERDAQNPDTIIARASVRLSGPPDITLSNVQGIFSASGRPGLRFTVTVTPTAQTGARNIIVENANHDIAIAFGALVVK